MIEFDLLFYCIGYGPDMRTPMTFVRQWRLGIELSMSRDFVFDV